MAIKIERTGSGLQAVVAAKIDWHIIPLTFLVVFWGWAVSWCWQRLLATLLTRVPLRWNLFAVTLMCTVGGLTVFWQMAKLLLGRDTVRVSPDFLDIEYAVLGFVVRKKSVRTQQVAGLRYEEWPGGRDGTQTAIRFESDGETYTFARQVKASEAYELINRMREIYKFRLPPEKPAAGVTSW